MQRLFTMIFIATLFCSSTYAPAQEKPHGARILSGTPGTVLFDLKGHIGTVAMARWSPDETKVVTAGADGDAIIWSVLTANKLITLHHADPVTDARWSPNGAIVATLSNDIAVLWSATTGAQITALNGHTKALSGIAWSPDGSKLATVSADATLMVWSGTTGANLLTCKGHTGEVTSVMWSPDGSKLATSSKDNSSILWSAATGEKLFTLQQTAKINGVMWSPDGTKVLTISSGFENGAVLWSAATGERLRVFDYAFEVFAADWSPDGTKIAFSGLGKPPLIWSVTTEKELFSLSEGGMPIRWSPDGNRIATVFPSEIAVFSGTNGAKLCTLIDQGPSIDWSADGSKILTSVSICSAETGKNLTFFGGHAGQVDNLRWSTDGASVTTISGDDRMCLLWSAKNGSKTSTLRTFYPDAMTATHLSPDGSKVILKNTKDSTTSIWSVENNQKLATFPVNLMKSTVKWSPDGSKITTRASDSTVTVWNAGNVQQIYTVKGSEIKGWNPDMSKFFMTGYKNTGGVYSAATGEKLISMDTTYQFTPGELSWSPDGTKFLSTKTNSAVIWSSDSGEKLFTLSGNGFSITGALWSPDGRKIAIACDTTLTIWSVATRDALVTITSPTEYIIGIRWSPDGSKIATVMTENTPVVWSAETGDKLYALAGHTAEITALQWSPDGSRIATASKDKTAKIWYIAEPIGVDEGIETVSAEFTLYPNPASKNIHLTFGESIAHPTTLRLVTMLGVHAASVTLPAGTSEWTMSVEGLPAGMYMAEWNGTARAVVVE
ncbi:MAG: hypothetical protein U0264_12680 [Candidatus Kapaibacterium sp.]